MEIKTELKSGGRYSKIAAELQARAAEFKRLRRVTISYRAPAWWRQASLVIRHAKGVETIADLDRRGYVEVWYKTRQNGTGAICYAKWCD